MRLAATRAADAFAPLRSWLLFVVLGAVLAFAAFLAFGNEIYDYYVWEYVRPELERELGFRIGRIQVTGEHGPYAVPAIVAVEPGGVFDRAGFRPGDIPVGYVHGFVGFYHQLHSARGKATTLHIVRAEDGGDWRKARDRSVAVPRR